MRCHCAGVLQEARSRHCTLAVLRRGRTLYVCGMKEANLCCKQTSVLVSCFGVSPTVAVQVWSVRIDRWGQRIEERQLSVSVQCQRNGQRGWLI
eukprot:6269867-Amphidinium_carterae.1